MRPQVTQLGIDIGGGSTKIALRLPGESPRTITSQSYANPTLSELRDAITDVLLSNPVSEPPLVGCCVPGKFGDANTLAYSANLPCLNGERIPEFVRTLLPTQPRAVAVLPDALAAALGSHAHRPATGRLLCLSLGTGVGAALLVDGAPVTLAPGTVGHLGQMDVSLDAQAPIGPDAGRGSLEAYIGLPALRARFGESHDDLIAGIASMTEDEPALRALARAIRIAHAIYTPSDVRLLGGLGGMLASKVGLITDLVNRDLTRVADAAWSLTAMDDPFYAASGAASFAGSSTEVD